ncbi:MAG: CotH kinase family protein [Lachnospiraceae bacterium]|nr:CotH kinase family protein [Lachnospiraceae bacterium]
MKRRFLIPGALSLSLAFIIIFFLIKASGGEEKALSGPDGSGRVTEATISPPVLSVPSGFYEDPFYLTLSAPAGTEIHYTLDGSEPTGESPLYKEEIKIYDPSGEPDRFAAETDIISRLDHDRYYPPEEPQDKAFILRAKAFRGDEYSESTDAVYFLGFENRPVYDSFPVVSVMTDPDNLFDPELGIMVSGKNADQYLSEHDPESISWDEDLTFGNFNQRGIDWEREGVVTLFDETHALTGSDKAGIRIKGGKSRVYPQKSLNLFARKEYSGSRCFSFPFFAGDTTEHSVTLYAGGNDTYTKMKDRLFEDLTKSLSFETVRSRPVFVFLNGEFWGFYHLSEHFGEDFLAEKYGIDPDNIVFAKSTTNEKRLEYDTEKMERIESGATYDELVNIAENRDLSDPEEYRHFTEAVDMTSLTEYYASRIYIENTRDWPTGNTAIWRVIDPGEKDGITDGRWRYLSFDVNTASMTALSENGIDLAREKSPLFDNLMKNSEFRKEFREVMYRLAGETFAPERVLPAIDALEERFAAPCDKTRERFYSGYPSKNYKEEVDVYREFFRKRPEYILRYTDEACLP